MREDENYNFFFLKFEKRKGAEDYCQPVISTPTNESCCWRSVPLFPLRHHANAANDIIGKVVIIYCLSKNAEIEKDHMETAFNRLLKN